MWTKILKWVVLINLCLFPLAAQTSTTDMKFTAGPSPKEIKKENQALHGLDVSHFQGDIDWDQLKQNDPAMSFVFIKASESDDNVEPNFEKNWNNAKRAGIVRGAYHFFDAKADARSQAMLFIQTVKLLEPGDLPPFLDLESGKFCAADEVAKQAFIAEVLVWLDVVEKGLGIKPLIYANPNFTETHLTDPMFAEYLPVVAEYDSQMDSPQMKGAWTGKTWTFWQFSDTGVVKGITGNVDLDDFNGSLTDLMKITKKKPTIKAESETFTTTTPKTETVETEAAAQPKAEEPKAEEPKTEEPKAAVDSKQPETETAASAVQEPAPAISLGKLFFPRTFIHKKKEYKKGVFHIDLETRAENGQEVFYFLVSDKDKKPVFEELAVIKIRERPVQRIGRRGFQLRNTMTAGYEYFKIMVILKDKHVFGYFLSKDVPKQEPTQQPTQQPEPDTQLIE